LINARDHWLVKLPVQIGAAKMLLDLAQEKGRNSEALLAAPAGPNKLFLQTLETKRKYFRCPLWTSVDQKISYCG
jgi:hypothetical protein